MVVLWSCCKYSILIDKATAAEAWHYVGAARVIRAYGFMLMTDLYGEMPYKSSEAEAGVTPTYNDGKQSIWAVWPILTPLSRCFKRARVCDSFVGCRRYLEWW